MSLPPRPEFPRAEWRMELPVEFPEIKVDNSERYPFFRVVFQPVSPLLNGDTRTARPPLSPMYPEGSFLAEAANKTANPAHPLYPGVEKDPQSVALFCSSNWEAFAPRLKGRVAFSVMHRDVHTPEWIYSYRPLGNFPKFVASAVRAAANCAVDVNPNKYDLVVCNADMPASLQITTDRTDQCRAGLSFALRTLRIRGQAAFCFPQITRYNQLEIFAAICRVFNSVTVSRKSASVDLQWVVAHGYKGPETLCTRMEQLMTGQRPVLLCPEELPVEITSQLFQWNYVCEVFSATGDSEMNRLPEIVAAEKVSYNPRVVTSVCDHLPTTAPDADVPDEDPWGTVPIQEETDVASITILEKPSERFRTAEGVDERDPIKRMVWYTFPSEGVMGYLLPTGEFVQAIHENGQADSVSPFYERDFSLLMQKASGFPVLPEGVAAFGMWSAHTSAPRFHAITTWQLSRQAWMPRDDARDHDHAVMSRWGKARPFIADPRITFAVPMMSPVLNGRQSVVTVSRQNKLRRLFYHNTPFIPTYISDRIEDKQNGLSILRGRGDPDIVPGRYREAAASSMATEDETSTVVWKDNDGKPHGEIEVTGGTPGFCLRARDWSFPEYDSHDILRSSPKGTKPVIKLENFSGVRPGMGAIRIQHRPKRLPLVTVSRLNFRSSLSVPLIIRGDLTQTVVPTVTDLK